MKNRRTLIFVLFILLIIVLSGCKEKKTKVGVLLYSSDDSALNIIYETFKNELDNSFEMIVKDAENSQMLQNDQFLELIDEGCELIIVNLVDRLSASVYVDKAKKQDIPLIFFNREPIWEDLYNYNKAYYVGNDGEAIGLMQAKIVGKMFSDPNDLSIYYDTNGNNIIEMVILKGEQGHQITETIFSTCINELHNKEYATSILATEYANWNRQNAKEAIRKLYYSSKCRDSRGKSNIEVVICNNDEMAMGVIDFIFEEEIYYISKTDGSYIMPFDIIGANITVSSLAAIESKYLFGSITGEEAKQGEVIAYLVKSLAKRKTPDLTIYDAAIYESGEHIYKLNKNFIYVNGEIVYSKRR